MSPLPRSFYELDTLSVARKLLGTILVFDSPRGRLSGRISETEAYLRDDAACHASRGKTLRNAVMFGPPGHAYFYLIYGMYECFNVVTAPEGVGEAVLIRALEPLEGIPLMQRRRKTKDLKSLCSGPGKLVQAMGMSLKQNGTDLCGDGKLFLLPGEMDKREIIATPRIGINVAVELPYRYYFRGDAFASRKCRAT